MLVGTKSKAFLHFPPENFSDVVLWSGAIRGMGSAGLDGPLNWGVLRAPRVLLKIVFFNASHNLNISFCFKGKQMRKQA